MFPEEHLPISWFPPTFWEKQWELCETEGFLNGRTDWETFNLWHSLRRFALRCNPDIFFLKCWFASFARSLASPSLPTACRVYVVGGFAWNKYAFAHIWLSRSYSDFKCQQMTSVGSRFWIYLPGQNIPSASISPHPIIPYIFCSRISSITINTGAIS